MFGGMLKSSKQHVDRGDVGWADKFSVMLAPHLAQYGAFFPADIAALFPL